METGSVEVTPRGGAAGGGGKSLRKIYAAIPLIPIVILSIIVIGLSGSATQHFLDPNKGLRGNKVSLVLLGYTPQAGTLAIVAAFAGLWYCLGKAENNGASAASASALALVSWANGILAFGFACKQTNFGRRGGLADELKGLAGLSILLFIFETVYVILLHLVIFSTS